MKEKIKKVSLIVSIIIVVGASFVYAKSLYAFALSVLYNPRWDNMLMLLSEIFLMGSIVYIVYKYLLCIIEAFQNKKKCKSILMILFIVFVIAIAVILELEAKTFLATVFLPFLYIIGIISIPLMILGTILLEESKNRKRKIILVIVLIAITIGIYMIHYSYLTTATRSVISNIQSFFISDENTTNLAEYNLTYLENYKQKMENKGYLDKYDVENILRIVDSRTDNIIVHYHDGEEDFEYNNVDNQLTEELGAKLESDFYKFQYTHKNEQTDIYIEKYESKTIENEETIKEAANKKDILIIGGGPAGMEAAYVLSKRGHNITLAEKSDRLGGTMIVAGYPIAKQHFAQATKYLVKRTYDCNINIELNTCVNEAYLSQHHFDHILVCCGAKPIELDICKNHPHSGVAQDILLGKMWAGKNIVIIGGGSVGCEVADFIAPLVTS